ncbi:hypothetical protein NIES4071_00010 [Calothrix sp. NIES-4071]|nr:hypothetical protein NIES4071_00010 [Calothrix sp. NIES-4071]BAZ54348.1 hypothetical protein NIES4105_00010 [Calothrix sp. NIES-4105]
MNYFREGKTLKGVATYIVGFVSCFSIFTATHGVRVEGKLTRTNDVAIEKTHTAVHLDMSFNQPNGFINTTRTAHIEGSVTRTGETTEASILLSINPQKKFLIAANTLEDKTSE